MGLKMDDNELKWEEIVHQTAFTYLKYKKYYNALNLLEKSDLKLQLYNSAFNDNPEEWALYIYTPIDIKERYDDEIKMTIYEAYDEALGTHTILGYIFVEMKKVLDSEFHFNFKDRMASLEKYDYDVVFSFAGENRGYVESVANALLYKKVRVFYDRFNTADSWGKNLYTHFDDIYRKRARYCVMFLSKYYAEKLWTNHERQMAQARAFEEQKEYILPVKFDDTEIPGIVSTISYINANEVEPKELAEIIVEKLE